VRWRDGVSAILFTVASGVLAWRMAVELQNAASLGGSTDLLGIPRAPILGVISLMFALAALIGLLNLFRRPGTGPPSATERHGPAAHG
jgi:TRAP-type C4-dicarboxylate transport system permease small subunit